MTALIKLKNETNETRLLNKFINELEKDINYEQISFEEQMKILQKKQEKIKIMRDRKLKSEYELRKLKKKESIYITDHAMLRFLERILFVNMEELKDKILPEKYRDLVIKSNQKSFPINDHKLIIKNNTIVSIVEG
jgi:hypothetical protein